MAVDGNGHRGARTDLRAVPRVWRKFPTGVSRRRSRRASGGARRAWHRRLPPPDALALQGRRGRRPARPRSPWVKSMTQIVFAEVGKPEARPAQPRGHRGGADNGDRLAPAVISCVHCWLSFKVAEIACHRAKRHAKGAVTCLALSGCQGGWSCRGRRDQRGSRLRGRRSAEPRKHWSPLRAGRG